MRHFLDNFLDISAILYIVLITAFLFPTWTWVVVNYIPDKSFLSILYFFMLTVATGTAISLLGISIIDTLCDAFIERTSKKEYEARQKERREKEEIVSDVHRIIRQRDDHYRKIDNG